MNQVKTEITNDLKAVVSNSANQASDHSGITEQFNLLSYKLSEPRIEQGAYRNPREFSSISSSPDLIPQQDTCLLTLPLNRNNEAIPKLRPSSFKYEPSNANSIENASLIRHYESISCSQELQQPIQPQLASYLNVQLVQSSDSQKEYLRNDADEPMDYYDNNSIFLPNVEGDEQHLGHEDDKSFIDLNSECFEQSMTNLSSIRSSPFYPGLQKRILIPTPCSTPFNLALLVQQTSASSSDSSDDPQNQEKELTTITEESKSYSSTRLINGSNSLQHLRQSNIKSSKDVSGSQAGLSSGNGGSGSISDLEKKTLAVINRNISPNSRMSYRNLELVHAINNDQSNSIDRNKTSVAMVWQNSATISNLTHGHTGTLMSQYSATNGSVSNNTSNKTLLGTQTVQPINVNEIVASSPESIPSFFEISQPNSIQNEKNRIRSQVWNRSGNGITSSSESSPSIFESSLPKVSSQQKSQSLQRRLSKPVPFNLSRVSTPVQSLENSSSFFQNSQPQVQSKSKTPQNRMSQSNILNGSGIFTHAALDASASLIHNRSQSKSKTPQHRMSQSNILNGSRVFAPSAPPQDSSFVSNLSIFESSEPRPTLQPSPNLSSSQRRMSDGLQDISYHVRANSNHSSQYSKNQINQTKNPETSKKKRVFSSDAEDLNTEQIRKKKSVKFFPDEPRVRQRRQSTCENNNNNNPYRYDLRPRPLFTYQPYWETVHKPARPIDPPLDFNHFHSANPKHPRM